MTSVKELPKAGDVCPSCVDHWEAERLPPKRLILLGTTIKKKDLVPACPYCDGERIIEIAEGNRDKRKR